MASISSSTVSSYSLGKITNIRWGFGNRLVKFLKIYFLFERERERVAAAAVAAAAGKDRGRGRESLKQTLH